MKKVLRCCLICVGVAGLTAGILGYSFGPQLLSIYITDSAEAISSGVLRLGIVCLFYFLCGLMDVSTGALRGMGASLEPMIISILGICVLRVGWISTIFQIPAFHTPQCLYLSYPISWILTFVAQLLAFRKVFRRHTQAMTK